MAKELIYILAMLGGLMVAVCLISVLHELLDWAKNHIYFLSTAYKNKKRFNSPPLAKCHCGECEYWRQFNNDEESGYCTSERKNTAYYWFCHDAIKKSKNEYLREKYSGLAAVKHDNEVYFERKEEG